MKRIIVSGREQGKPRIPQPQFPSCKMEIIRASTTELLKESNKIMMHKALRTASNIYQGLRK